MKIKITALALIAALACSLAPKPAQASDKGLAIVGGFIGGLIVANAINDSQRDFGYPDRVPATIIVGDRHDRRNGGYWEHVTVKVWVPGYWVMERGHHGRSYRRYVDGYYTFRTDRVWVSFDRSDRRGHEVRYGYGR